MKQIFAAALLFAASICASAADLNTARIDQLTGLKGKMNEKEGVYKITFPRNDVKVVVDGWTMPPFMGLGTWAAFTETGNGAMVMGDTVLFEDEVNAAMSAALDNGLNVTALHNHFFFDHRRCSSCTSKGKARSRSWRARSEKFTTLRKQSARPNPKPADSFSAAGQPSLPEKNSITAAPLNEIFGMHRANRKTEW